MRCHHETYYELGASPDSISSQLPERGHCRGETAQGETTDVKGQQRLGLPGSGSSDVITGGPEIIEGKIIAIQGNNYPFVGSMVRTSRSG